MQTPRRNVLYLLIIVVALGILATFFAQNATPLRITFAVWKSAELPFFIIVFLAALFGFVVALIGSMIENVSLKRLIRKQRKKIELLEREVDTLRNQPLYEEAAAEEGVPSDGPAEPPDLSLGQEEDS